MNAYIIEIATTDFITTQEAIKGGADRIELCSALSEGGITPSYGLIRQCREKFDLPIFPIIRPRSGDFLYTEEEFGIMLQDVRMCRELRCDGVVIGLLKENGEIDNRRTEMLVNLAYPMEVTFHRAFDRCRDPFEAMEQLIELGCSRILTSGQKPTAVEGSSMINELIRKADNDIIIMPGSGIRKENIREIAMLTGATEFHSSLKGKSRSGMQFVHPSFEASEESYSNPFVEAAEVKALRKRLNE